MSSLIRSVLAGVALLIGGCSLLPGDSGPDTAYKTAPEGRSLELPPGLGGGEKRPQVGIPKGQDCAPCAQAEAPTEPQPVAEVVLPRLSDARMVRDGAVNWLELQSSVESVWALSLIHI